MRNLHLWFAAGLGVLLAIFAGAVLRTALAESLWLDELHTSWSINGTWQEIASRAAAGNQTPLYFWLVGVLSQTLGQLNGQQSEWMLRLPSAIAWLLTIALVAHLVHSKVPPTDPRKWSFAVSIVAWIILDRLQWFFASEARPYACVQLVSLAGWCCVEGVVRNFGRDKSKTWKLVVAWSLLSIVNIYLHLTAALPVLFQWVTAGGLIAWKHYRMRRAGAAEEIRSGQWPHVMGPRATGILAALAVGLALLPILQLAFPVWQRRGQWATFASDVSLYRATTMFPFGPVLVCVFIACMLDRLCKQGSWFREKPDVERGHLKAGFSRNQLPENASQRCTEERCLWWIAMLGPWLTAWALTTLGIAPMFHPRFVFASAVPLFVVGAIELLGCRRWSIRWGTILAIGIAIPISQGSVSIWQAGYLVGNLRGEDWRAATQWVNEHYAPGEPLLCSSGLIEASSNSTEPHSLPLEAGFAEYLSFPLLGLYQVSDASRNRAPVTPLLGDHRHWATQVVERLSEGTTRAERMWLFYRGAPGRLKTKLSEFQSDMHSNGVKIEADEPQRFGNVFVVELNMIDQQP